MGKLIKLGKLFKKELVEAFKRKIKLLWKGSAKFSKKSLAHPLHNR